MDMALAKTGIGDADELGALLQGMDRLRTRITHGRLHAADKLVDDVAGVALVRHLSLDPLGHELEMILDVLLEVAIRRAPRHRPAPIGSASCRERGCQYV